MQKAHGHLGPLKLGMWALGRVIVTLDHLGLFKKVKKTA